MSAILERVFEVDGEAVSRPAYVRVYAPKKASNGDWTCRIQFEGFAKTDDQPHAFLGVDAWQAMLHAMGIAPEILKATIEFAEGRLRFLGETLTAGNLSGVMQVK